MRGGILKKKIFSLLLIVILTAAFIAGCMMPQVVENNETNGWADEKEQAINEDGKYTSAEEVALYIRTYGRLPSNFITKKEAMALGWNSEKGNLWDVTDRMSIGGDSFGNREGTLPKKEGRKWFECDINYEGGYRGAERIVYSNDGLIYYTNDHYKTFVQLY